MAGDKDLGRNEATDNTSTDNHDGHLVAKLGHVVREQVDDARKRNEAGNKAGAEKKAEQPKYAQKGSEAEPVKPNDSVVSSSDAKFMTNEWLLEVLDKFSKYHDTESLVDMLDGFSDVKQKYSFDRRLYAGLDPSTDEQKQKDLFNMIKKAIS